MAILLVFLKYPSAGKVKTRLAASIGPGRAASLYRQWIGLVLERVQPLRGQSLGGQARVVGYFDGGSQQDFAPWDALVDEWWPQPAGDLGDRLRAGFDAAHALSEPVVAIGTDCLELDAPLLEAAFEALDRNDVVFGPALDGGYYLIGTSRNLPGFFDDVPWSSPSTLAAHLSLCARSAWSVELLDPRRDIDTVADWLAHQRTEDAAP
jgi:rSAM/selenodomain-associated transferase 1